MTGCGETSESTAARMHNLVFWLYIVVLGTHALMLPLYTIMAVWHGKSARTHERRGLAGG